MKLSKLNHVLIVVLTVLFGLSTQAQSMSEYEKIDCIRPGVQKQTIWPKVYAEGKLYLIVTGFRIVESLTEEVENGGVPIFRESALANLGYEIKKQFRIADETIILLTAPGQFFQADQNLILRTKDFRTGNLETGSFRGNTEDYPKKWAMITQMDCQFTD